MSLRNQKVICFFQTALYVTISKTSEDKAIYIIIYCLVITLI